MKELITLEMYRGPNPLEASLEANAIDLLIKTNSLLQELGVDHTLMTSGYRSPEHNAKIGGMPKSNHCKALAIDLDDTDRYIGNKIMTNLKVLISRGMAMESLAYCVTAKGTKWVHLQAVVPRSGNTVFVPYEGGPRYV